MTAPAREGTLLKKAQALLEKNGKLPSNYELGKILGCRQVIAASIKKQAQGDILIDRPSAVAPERGDSKTPVETDDVSGDTRILTKVSDRSIASLDELIAYCNIDETVWFVERYVCNKWEMGYKDADGNAHTKPLFQVKAWMIRKVEGCKEEGDYIKSISNLRAKLAKQGKEITAEKRLNKHLALNHLGADDFLAEISGFMDKMSDMSLPYTRPSVHAPLIQPVVSGGHTEDGVLLLSDTHYGDQIRRNDTSGFPIFNLPISGNRTGYVIEKAKQVLTLHRAMYPIDTLNVWIGGDIGNGILHDSPNSNALFTPAQVHFSYHMLKFAIEDLLTLCQPDEKGNKIVKKLKLMFTVGNHMRMDEKMPMKFQAQRTLDWLIYQFLIERFKLNPNVEIKLEMAPYIFENIRGHRHLFAHGMQVGYRNSPDAQCKSMASFIDRVRALFDSPEWRNANKLQGETFARICIGDIHVPVSFPRLISNGSLNGQNELGVNWVMEPIPAGQQLFGVSDNHLETWKYFLDCTHVQDEAAHQNSYGTFAREYALEIGR